MRTPTARIAAACLLVALLSPADAAAQLGQFSSGFAARHRSSRPRRPGVPPVA